MEELNKQVENLSIDNKKKLGQYFTTSDNLKKKVFEFIKNNPKTILEPSVGRGDLILHRNKYKYDMYEVDNTIQPLNGLKGIKYCDFMKEDINKKYKTIIGNPPYVKSKKSNLYIEFIEKCFNLLSEKGELIFIIPSDFFKLTSSSKLIISMIKEGSFTHIYNPNDEKLFKGASVDVLIFRYCKDIKLDNKVLYNDKPMFINSSSGIITFTESNIIEGEIKRISDYFDVYVGMVSGKDSVFKNNDIGNINLISNCSKFIFIEEYPSGNDEIDLYLENHKEELMGRKIIKMTESNWFKWGAPRNKKVMEEHKGEDCIYVRNLTRNDIVAFKDKIDYFGGNLLLLKPKTTDIDLDEITEIINSENFRKNYMFSGRFKIGHKQLENSIVKSVF